MRLLLLHLHLGGSAHLDKCYAAGQLGQTLLELLLVVVGGSDFDWLLIWPMRADLFELPAPLTMVVFSLLTFTWRA